MKSRFTTLDLVCELRELQRLVGMRVNQVYDVDHKTYLLRLQRPEEKAVLLMESGARLHSTAFEWPKSPAPSGFAMKLRKHINNKRLESARQLGIDRVVDLQFGTDDAAYHVLLELYDRGNIVLTDCDYKILNILRPRVQGEDKFLVRETYPVELAKERAEVMTEEKVRDIMSRAKPGDTVKKLFVPHFEYGPPFFEHLLLSEGLTNFKVGKDFQPSDDQCQRLVAVFGKAAGFLESNPSAGFIVQKREMRPKPDGTEEEFLSYVEFHPFALKQNEGRPSGTFGTFDGAVDEFFSKVESQKIELKAMQQERQALKKLDNVKKDHEARLDQLQLDQARDRRKAELIEMNQKLVEAALTVMRSAIANQIDWKEIGELVKEATDSGDPVASRIKKLKLETNHFTMLLTDPYSHLHEESDDDDDSGDTFSSCKEMEVDIEIDLSAQSNARKYYHQKKSAAAKEKKTLDSHSTAMKSAEKKTKQTLKEVAAITNINKARKVFWFEKFFWFISSENYLVVAGRDMQQNELIVKRYMRPGDVYVHADLHGASSVVIKNPTGLPVPPKTLNEAGQMAVCYSVAWENKVVTSAWWVEASQVSKTAPSGEYLTAGSFMIRGKKNFLLPAHLILGFGFLFRLEEGSVERHKDERKVKTANDDLLSLAGSESTQQDVESLANDVADVEIALEEGDSSNEEEELKDDPGKTDLHDIKEELEEGQSQLEEGEKSEDGEENPEEKEKEEADVEEEGESDGSDPSSAFPDTSVDIDYTKQGEAKIKARGLSESSDRKDEDIIFTSKPRKPKQQQVKKEKDKAKKQQEQQADDGGRQQNKRGKKGKMKKMREKYKDQDDEERELRMQILQGAQRDNRKRDKKAGKAEAARALAEEKQKRAKQQQQKRQNNAPAGSGAAPEDEEDDRAANVNTEVDMLDTLTGLPVPEDEILFAVPVVAPYSVLNSYKFRVKLTPGSGKRGKATKTALAMFLADKTITQRDKDLLKSVKDQDLARNLPGKVKLSAPHLQKVKGKKK